MNSSNIVCWAHHVANQPPQVDQQVALLDARGQALGYLAALLDDQGISGRPFLADVDVRPTDEFALYVFLR